MNKVNHTSENSCGLYDQTEGKQIGVPQEFLLPLIFVGSSPPASLGSRSGGHWVGATWGGGERVPRPAELDDLAEAGARGGEAVEESHGARDLCEGVRTERVALAGRLRRTS